MPLHDVAMGDERWFVDAVLAEAGSLVCVFDRDGRFLRFNRACERLSALGDAVRVALEVRTTKRAGRNKVVAV